MPRAASTRSQKSPRGEPPKNILKTLTNVSGLTIGDGTNGGLAANYTLSGGTQTMSVTKRPITISGSRFYDGTSTVSSSDITTFNNKAGGFGVLENACRKHFTIKVMFFLSSP